MKHLIYILWTFLISYCKCSAVERLFDQIFMEQGYNLMVRPEEDGITNVYTELKILQIDLDEKYQELISIVWLEMTWTDERLKWNITQYDNISDIIIPVSKIWVPDIVLQNGVGKNEYLYDMKQFNPWISHTGLITWVPEIRIHTKCTIKVSDFPFDTQRCEINFYSWAHTVKQMRIQQFENKNVTNTTHLNRNTEWNIFHTCASNKTIITSINLEWWTTSYTLFIKRRNYYHVFNLIIPYFILTMCSTNLFLLPPETGEKISLAVSLLLTFFLNLAILSNYIPESSNELPIIASYYLFNICLISASLAASVCVLNIYFRSDNDTKVPRWLKLILLINLRQKSAINSDYDIENSISKAQRDEESPFVKFNKQRNLASKGFLTSADSKNFLLKDKSIDNVNCEETVLNEVNSDNKCKRSTLIKNKKPKSQSSITSLNEVNNSEQQLPNQLSENILQLFHKLIEGIEKRHETLVANKPVNLTAKSGGSGEWREIGRRVDRFLFILSMIVVFASQLIFFLKFYYKNLLPKCIECLCDESK